MSDKIKHECGIALLRLLKPPEYYEQKYGTRSYAINKLQLLLNKQRNRGQDGAGLASLKINQEPGKQIVSVRRSVAADPISDIFQTLSTEFASAEKDDVPFGGEVFLGHLRYGTHGKNSISATHPVVRENNWRSRLLMLAGNFNMTNVDDLFQTLVDIGQHPRAMTDTVTILEKVGHFLDEENHDLYKQYSKSEPSNREIARLIEENIDMGSVLRRACRYFDGGYVLAGMLGHGTSFVARDGWGIRPAYYFANDEVVVAASEKPAIKTAFSIEYDEIKEVPPGHALITEPSGEHNIQQVTELGSRKSCSFERIYFSRGNDPEIYQERKKLGRLLAPQIVKEIGGDFEHTVFSYIPSTAEVSYLGMIEGLGDYLSEIKFEAIKNNKLKDAELKNLLSIRPRVEKLVVKDQKLRTFITNDGDRDQMVAHAYDTTYETIQKGVDTLVVIDDSIVRGTTLKKSIIKNLTQLEPKKIVIVSSAPQIRYPDCYGIDMSRLSDFAAFRAMMALIDDTKQGAKRDEVYQKCKEALREKKTEVVNHVKELYNLFDATQISAKIAEQISGSIDCEVVVIYQNIENLHKAMPKNLGDWYFTGNYPTSGGSIVANRAFVNHIEGNKTRSY